MAYDHAGRGYGSQLQRTAAASGDDMAAVREALHASAANGGGHIGVGHLEDTAHAAAQSRTFHDKGERLPEERQIRVVLTPVTGLMVANTGRSVGHGLKDRCRQES